jgi:hypothetical protein
MQPTVGAIENIAAKLDSSISTSDLESNKTLCEVVQGNVYEPKIWVGYRNGGRYFIDRYALSGSTQRRMEELRRWWRRRTSWHKRLITFIFLYQRPVVLIGYLPLVRAHERLSYCEVDNA